MDKIQNAYLQMTSAVKATCDAHHTAWTGYASFETPYNAFLALFPEVDAAIALQEKSTEGTTIAKNNFRQELFAATVQLGIALHQYGKDTANAALTSDAKMSSSDIDKLSEKALVGHAVKLKGLVPTPVPAALSGTPYFITPAFITDFDVKITRFSNAIGTPRHIMAEKVRGTENLNAAIVSLRALLVDMDSAADVLQYTQAAFYSEYKTSREIEDAATMPRALTVTVINDISGEPIEGAEATFVPTRPAKTSGAHGMFYIQNMPNGSHTMTVTKPGFATNISTFAVDDEGAQLMVRMVE